MGGGGKKGGKAIAWSQIFTWTSQSATSMWIALQPVWTTITSLWNSVKPLWDSVNSIYQTLKSYITDLYTEFIKPAFDLVNAAWDKINELIGWIDKIYQETIGRIEGVYNRLFGHIEELWRTFEDTRDRILRVVAIFNRDLAQKLYDTTEKLEASTIGQIRNLRDELLHQIDKVYTDLRDRINDMYYAVKDLITPLEEARAKIEDFLGIAFEKPNLLRRETVKMTADTYGQEWWDSTMTRIAPRIKRADVEVTLRGTIRTRTDEAVEEMDKGRDGAWADVYNYVDDAVALMDAGGDPASFEPDTTLMSREDLEESLRVPRPPDSPEAIAEEEE